MYLQQHVESEVTFIDQGEDFAVTSLSVSNVRHTNGFELWEVSQLCVLDDAHLFTLVHLLFDYEIILPLGAAIKISTSMQVSRNGILFTTESSYTRYIGCFFFLATVALKNADTE